MGKALFQENVGRSHDVRLYQYRAEGQNNMFRGAVALPAM